MDHIDQRLTNLTVGQRESAQIDECLARLRDDTGASHIMLLDRAGQIISAHGGEQRSFEMMHLGALLAGAYATSHEMARLLKETGFRVLVQEGLREKIFTEAVEDRWLLAVVFDQQAHLGLIKVLARRTTQVLEGILHAVIDDNLNRRAMVGNHVRKASIDTIDLLFNDESTAQVQAQVQVQVHVQAQVQPNTTEKK